MRCILDDDDEKRRRIKIATATPFKCDAEQKE